jgi:hypothetical protein
MNSERIMSYSELKNQGKHEFKCYLSATVVILL